MCMCVYLQRPQTHMHACIGTCKCVCKHTQLVGVLFLRDSVMYIFLERLALFFYMLRQGHMTASVCSCMYVFVQLWGCCAEWGVL